MPERPHRDDELDLSRRLLSTGGAAIRTAAEYIDRAVVRAAHLAADTERAFRQGRDPAIEEAQILEESDEPFEP